MLCLLWDWALSQNNNILQNIQNKKQTGTELGQAQRIAEHKDKKVNQDDLMCFCILMS